MVQQPILQDPSPYLPEPRSPWPLRIALALLAAAALFFGWRLVRNRAVPSPVEPVPTAETAPAPLPAPPPAPPAAAPVPSPLTPPAAGAAPTAANLESVSALEREGRLAEARAACLDLLERATDGPTRDAIEAKAGALALELVMNPHPMPEKTDYVVAAGDSVEKIARRFGTTRELVARGNQLANPDRIKRGDRLRVLHGAFKVQIDKSRKTLALTLNDRFFKRYPIGTGKFGKTPVGTFVIRDRIAQPVWWRPDGKAIPFGAPENILGTHWLAITPTGDTPPVSGYGIHGTWEEASIGKEESAGCVRLRNADIEALFTLLPVGVEVVIAE